MDKLIDYDLSGYAQNIIKFFNLLCYKVCGNDQYISCKVLSLNDQRGFEMTKRD